MNQREIKYPRYTRGQKLSAKLTEEDIKTIKQLHRDGISDYRMGRMFRVYPTTILRARQSNKWKKEYFHQKYLTYGCISSSKASIKYRKRKKILQGKEFNEWYKGLFKPPNIYENSELLK